MKKSRSARLILLTLIVATMWNGGGGSRLMGQSRAGGPAGKEKIALAPELAVIFNSDIDPRTRFEAVHSLGGNLREMEATAICRFLQSRPDSREQNLPALQLIKNDLINVLLEQRMVPGGLADVLMEIYRDQQQDFVTRDYAVQHLVTWYEQQGMAAAAETRARVRHELSQIARTETSIAGTALLGMHRLAAVDQGLDRHQIRQRAVEMVDSLTLSPAARVTAIQICSEEGAVEAVPSIRSLVQSEGSTVLRISAIAALGQLGSEQDLALLEGLSSSTPDGGLYAAILGALKQLQQKVHPQKLALNQD